MNENRLINSLFMGVFGLLLMNTIQAGTPVWTFAQVSGYPPSVSVSASGTATIKYTVTNQSHKSHQLQMKPIQGITPTGCISPLEYHQPCTLTLTVNGSRLKKNVLGGPVLCEQGNPNQCYQPSQANSLAIRLTQTPPTQEYTVTSSAGTNGSISPSSSQTVTAGSTLTFTATPDAGFGVSQWQVDGTLAQTGNITFTLANIRSDHNVTVTFGTEILTRSVTTLALSTNCRPSSSCGSTQNAELTGKSRQITIHNSGSANATNVSVSAPNLPSGTSFSSNCNGTLNPGSSCIITLTPGSVASSDLNGASCTIGTQPVASTITVTADGGISSQINTYVLGYGCQYQGGFLYSVNDRYTDYPATGSIGGKVASLVDQARTKGAGIIWSSNGNSAASGDVDHTAILGIDETSTTSIPSPTSPAYPTGTPAYIACYGSSDGACDSSNILSYYNFKRGNGGSAPTPLTYYAAGLCTATINSYSGWYLPSICEMQEEYGDVTCPPGAQSMITNLFFLRGDPDAATPSTSCNPPSGTQCLAGLYWSSTEFSDDPQDQAWNALFDSSGILPGSNVDKAFALGVRCSRALTP